MTTLRILGSAAGGGFPQWNCNCRNCDGVRHGTVRAVPRTQSSLAITGNGIDWLLVNASPDILMQLRQAPALQPGRQARDTCIAAVLLMVLSAAAVLQRCDGSRTVAQIIDDLQASYAQADLAADVHAFVSHAAGRGWLV